MYRLRRLSASSLVSRFSAVRLQLHVQFFAYGLDPTENQLLRLFVFPGGRHDVQPPAVVCDSPAGSLLQAFEDVLVVFPRDAIQGKYRGFWKVVDSVEISVLSMVSLYKAK